MPATTAVKTLAKKLWESHVVREGGNEPDLLYVDLHLVHEVTSPQAFEGLRLAGRRVRRPDLTVATMDHNVPTRGGVRAADELSRKQMEGLRTFAAKNTGPGVKVYWVSVDSENAKSKNYASDETLRAFARKYGINIPVLRDPDGAVSAKFGVDQLPSLVVLDKKGVVVGEPIGGLDPDGNIAEQLKEPIAEALARK